MKYIKVGNKYIDENNKEHQYIEYHNQGLAYCFSASLSPVFSESPNIIFFSEEKCLVCNETRTLLHRDNGPTSLRNNQASRWFYRGRRIK